MISTLIKEVTASSDTTVSFVDGTSSVVFDSTYDHYMFVCYDLNPEDDAAFFQFQVNATDDAGGGYDTSQIHSTHHQVWNLSTGGSDEDTNYNTSHDLDEAASFQHLSSGIGNGADESAAGILHIFSPASTTYMKQFFSRFTTHHATNYVYGNYVQGYINDATAIDEIQFKMTSGDWDGVIQMYGIA